MKTPIGHEEAEKCTKITLEEMYKCMTMADQKVINLGFKEISEKKLEEMTDESLIQSVYTLCRLGLGKEIVEFNKMIIGKMTELRRGLTQKERDEIFQRTIGTKLLEEGEEG